MDSRKKTKTKFRIYPCETKFWMRKKIPHAEKEFRKRKKIPHILIIIQ